MVNCGQDPRCKQLRAQMTPQERHLWYDFLRTYPIPFRRQQKFGNYIVDFYCHQAKLVIELDGSQHYEEKSITYDRIRTQHLEALGLHVVRYPNNEIQQNFSAVCEDIDHRVREILHMEDDWER